MVAVGTKLQVKEQRSRAGNFVHETATHAHCDIEVNIRRLHAEPQVSTIAAGETVATLHSDDLVAPNYVVKTTK